MGKYPPYCEVSPDGILKYNLTDPQIEAMNSTARFTWLLCGTQFGKTVLSPIWLHKEIQKYGPGDYIAGTTNFPLLDKKMLPEFEKLFCGILKVGKYVDKKKAIMFNDGKTRIIFFTAEKSDSIESATAISACLDEVGQDDWKEKTWEAIQSRLSIASDINGLNAGRVLGTTTLYNFGWLKYRVYNAWLKGDKTHNVIHADSIENPAFPPEEYYRCQKQMPAWKFDLRYRGRYSHPAGLVYDSFDDVGHVIKRFKIPPEWTRFIGVDFSTPATGMMFYAVEPGTGHYYAYREYLKGGLSSADHAKNLKELCEGENIIKTVGGAAGEDGWRESFKAAGWSIQKPNMGRLEDGIDRVYAFHKLNRLSVFDDLDTYLTEKQSYSWEIDENQNPTGKISGKQKYHLMDAERYILSEFHAGAAMGNKLVSLRY